MAESCEDLESYLPVWKPVVDLQYIDNSKEEGIIVFRSGMRCWDRQIGHVGNWSDSNKQIHFLWEVLRHEARPQEEECRALWMANVS